MASEGVPEGGHPEPLRSGYRAGRRIGWGGLAPGAYVAYMTIPQGPRSRELTVGLVLVNHREQQEITVQPHRGKWGGVRVVHTPLFSSPEGEVGGPGHPTLKAQVRYQALVLQVELLAGGELTYGSSRTLSNRGWGLMLEEEEDPDLAAPGLPPFHRLLPQRFIWDIVSMGGWTRKGIPLHEGSKKVEFDDVEEWWEDICNEAEQVPQVIVGSALAGDLPVGFASLKSVDQGVITLAEQAEEAERSTAVSRTTAAIEPVLVKQDQ